MTFASTLLPMPAQTLALSRYDVACRALAEAKAVDDIVEIVGQANAVHAYARQAKNRQMEIDAAEIRIRAERRLGELMAAQKATVGVAKGVLRRGVASTPREPTAPPTLAEAGIDKNLAKRARSYAAVPPVTVRAAPDGQAAEREPPRRARSRHSGGGRRHRERARPACRPNRRQWGRRREWPAGSARGGAATAHRRADRGERRVKGRREDVEGARSRRRLVGAGGMSQKDRDMR